MSESDERVEVSQEEKEAIIRLAQNTLQFGVDCASPIPAEVFDDPTLHTYYLFFVFGGMEWLGDHLDPDKPMRYQAKLAAMASALARFDDADRESVQGTVLMIHNATDEPAMRIRQAGRDAARLWHGDDKAAAEQVFKQLLDDPSNFPREVRPSGPPAGEQMH